MLVPRSEHSLSGTNYNLEELLTIYLDKVTMHHLKIEALKFVSHVQEQKNYTCPLQA